MTTQLLPHRQISDSENLTKLDAYNVGDVVGVYSRGAPRAAQVVKVGRTNVTVAYTTEGAIKEATDRWEREANITEGAIEAEARSHAKMVAGDYAYDLRELNPRTARWFHDTDSLVRMAENVSEPVETRTDQAKRATRARLMNRRDAAVMTGREAFILGAANVTNKSVKVADVFGLVAGA